MLERLDDHPWDHIHHAYGTCEDAPRMLRDLAAGNDGAKHTLGWLDNCCFHQETHYEANTHVMPYLLEIAATPSVPNRESLFQFLFRWFSDAEGCLPPKSPAQRAEWLEKLDDPSMFYGLDSSEYWRRMKDDALGAAWHSRRHLLTMLRADPEARARAVAATLLAQLVLFGQHVGRSWWEDFPAVWFDLTEAGQIAEVLADAARIDSNRAVRVAAILSLGVMRDVQRAEEMSLELWASAESGVEKAAGAAACLIGRSPASRAVVDDFVEGATTELPRDDSLRIVPWLFEPNKSHEVTFAAQVNARMGAWIKTASCKLEDLLAAIARALMRPEPGGRRAALALLSWFPRLPNKLIAQLRGLLVDDDPIARCRAARAIHRHAPPRHAGELVAVFRASLASADAKVRREGLEILGQMYTNLHPDIGLRGDSEKRRPPREKPYSPEGHPAWLASRPLPLAAPLLAETGWLENEDENCRLYSALIYRANIECSEVVRNQELPLPGALQIRQLALAWCDDPARAHYGVRIINSASISYQDSSSFTDDEVARFSRRWMSLIQERHPRQITIAGCLCSLKSPLVLPLLIDLVADAGQDPGVREQAAYAIRWLDKDASALPTMIAALATGNLALAQEIAYYFSVTDLGVNDQHAAASLIDAVIKDVHTRDGFRLRSVLPPALGALKVQHAEAARALALVASSDPESHVRSASARELANTFPDALLQEVCLPCVAEWDADALAGFLRPFADRREMFPALAATASVHLLTHPDHRVRELTVEALHRVPADAERQRAVASLLRDPHQSVRSQAMWWSFRSLDPREVAPALLAMVTGGERCPYAWKSITRLGLDDETMATAARAALSGPDELVTAVCEWLIDHPLPALAPLFRNRLKEPALSLGARYHLTAAWWAIEPAAKPEILAALAPAEGFPLRCVIEKFHELRALIESG